MRKSDATIEFAANEQKERGPNKAAAMLADLAAKKLRLPPGEAAFMASVANSFDDEYPVKAGAWVSFDSSETRSALGIEKKGLARVSLAPPGAGGGIALTECGAAWVRGKRNAVASDN